MKPLAILRDSLREAWDSKILLVMLVMAGLFLLIVASIDYRPAAADAVLEDYASDLSRNLLWVDRGKAPLPLQRHLATFRVKDVRTIREAGMPANGEHQFTIEVRNPDDLPKGFDLLVAAWHEDGSGKFIKVEQKNAFTPADVPPVVADVTDEMVREYFTGTLAKFRELPVTAFTRLPNPDEQSRAYQVTVGPSTEPRSWPVTLSLLFGVYDDEKMVFPLGILLYIIQDLIINSVGGMVIIMMGVITTAFFIPNMLRGGSVALVISKPIGRITLLLFKYIGGTFWVLILATVVVGGTWAITGLRSGVWAPNFLLVIPLLTFAFAILYSVSTLAAVLTRSSIVSILVTVAFGGLLWLVGKAASFADVFRGPIEARAELRKETPEIPTWIRVTDTLNATLPRWHDIDVMSGKVVQDSLLTDTQRKMQQESGKRKYPSWTGTIGVSLIWLVAFLGIACWRFSVKDY